MSHSEDRGQHYIECATCTNYSKFYCNTCHHRLCEQHRDSHLNDAENIKHEIVLYQERIQELPTEKCLIHPKRDLEIYCNECQIPVCSRCFTTDHKGHQVLDLEVVYNECLQQCQIELIKLRDTIFPQSVEKLKTWRGRVETVKEEIAKIRLSMRKTTDEIKAAVDTILAENNSELDKMELSILDDMCTEGKEMEKYIFQLQERIKVYESRTSLSKPSEVFTFRKEIAGIPSIKMSNTSVPVLPEFIKGTIAKTELEKQFGKIGLYDPNPQKSKKTHILQISQPSRPRFSLACNCNIVKIKETPMPKIRSVHHLSFTPSGEVWVSDDHGNLVLSDLQGNLIQEFSTDVLPTTGSHTVTADGELLYTDYKNRAIHRVTTNMTKTTLITTGDWYPGAIFSSHINGDILVGMNKDKDKKWKVTRYSKEGRKFQDIRRHTKSLDLYRNIEYITENINGDICVSDCVTNKVVVVTRPGQHRFSYSVHPSYLLGICTDGVGHILVCQSETQFVLPIKNKVHVLDQEGRFLTTILTQKYACDICVDDKQNLWVGCQDDPTVTVYKYLEEK